MTTQEENLQQWKNRPEAKTHRYIIDMHDTFDHDHYPVFCKDQKELAEKIKEYKSKSMQTIEDVFDLEGGCLPINYRAFIGESLHTPAFRNASSILNVPIVQKAFEITETINAIKPKDPHTNLPEVRTIEELEEAIRKIFIEKAWNVPNQTDWFKLKITSTYKDKRVKVTRMLDKKVLAEIDAETYVGAFSMILENIQSKLSWKQ